MADNKKKRVPASVVWRETRELIARHRRYLTVGFVLMILSRLAGLVLPLSSKTLVDDIIKGGRQDLILPIAVAVGIAALVQAATSFSLSQVISITAQRAITEMRRRVEEHVTRLPVKFFDSTQSGNLISRIMTDAEGIRNLVGTGIVQLVGGAITAVFSLGMLFWLNWQLTLGILALLMVFGATMASAFTRLRPVFRERGELNARVTGRLAETLGGIRIVKAYGTEKREDRVFTKGVHNLFRNVSRTITGTSAISAFAIVVIGAIGVLMIVFGGNAGIAGEMTEGGLLQYVIFTGMMAAPVIQIASISTQISEAFAGLDRIRELLGLPTEFDEDEGRRSIQSVEGEVEFQDVWFEYVEGVPVLKGVNLHAPAGSTTALVGSSGSGKSTLIGLIMGFHRPTQGRILVDGIDIQEIRLSDYRAQLGVVMQDNFLFDGTVADNIRFARPDATDDEVREAARIAHCDDFALALPEGYRTIVGERGVKLSGGQRQRVGIARAILADPRILILDEATSSLDSESEARIQDGLRSLRQGRTTFVIAHRLSTIRTANQILVLEGGRVVERGTHTELMAAEGRYRELHDRQYAWETEKFVNPGEDFTPENETPSPKVRTPRATAL
jgi:subfamily B ATP-binding cassette protein MsbA